MWNYTNNKNIQKTTEWKNNESRHLKKYEISKSSQSWLKAKLKKIKGTECKY